MIGLIDIGLGNQRSVANALEAIGATWRVCERPNTMKACSAFVLPGVGCFSRASKQLFNGGWFDALNEEVLSKKKPYLGICLGMQLLAEIGHEKGPSNGLRWIPGEVEPIPLKDVSMRIPHMGWNDVSFRDAANGLSVGLGEASCFYFMHSFQLHAADPEDVKGITRYGCDIIACVQRRHIWGTQFHPEKSQRAGLTLLSNFHKQVNQS